MSILRLKHNASSYHKLEGTLDSRKNFILLSRTAFLKNLVTSLFFLFSFVIINAQQTEADFKKTLHDRSVKIVNSLGLTDSGKYNNVVDLLRRHHELEEENSKMKDKLRLLDAS